MLHSLLSVAAFAALDSSPPSLLCERAISVARRSRCPSSQWKHVAAQALVARSASANASAEPLLYVNAGANKGFAVAEFLQRFADRGGGAPTNKQWFKAIRQIKPSGMFSCGICSACKEAPPPPSERHNVSVRVIAFELLKPNHWLLTKLFAHYSVPGDAFHIAVSNYSGVAYAPTGVRTGQEWTSAELGEADTGATDTSTSTASGAAPGRSPKRTKGWTAVPSTTIDAFMRRARIPHIHWLSVDAEGWDALILEGASGLLSGKHIDILEFEYHSKGMWATKQPEADRRNLKDTLKSLQSNGYTCFWQGAERGALAEASGGRWCDSFEFREHSNLMCSHLEPLVVALRHMEAAQRSSQKLSKGKRRPK